ncbi:MAG: TetR/AcrR family transcriptional regulator [Roseiarcus sp.]
MIKAARRTAPRRYHHGNLAAALVEAALTLLDETQDWAFSLREVARRAGVSHNAPYKHFPEKRDLLAAVAARGFEALGGRTLSSLEGVTDARARLLACGQAFVAHGVDNPALYRLMFGAALTTPEAGRPAIEKVAAAKARAIVDATLAQAVRAGAFPPGMANPPESAAASLAMWSVLHGLTMLAIDDFVGPLKDVESLVEPLLGALLDGLASRPPALPANIWMAPRL